MSNLDFNIYEDDKILQFFKIILSEEKLYSVNDTQSLIYDCLNITGHNECNEERFVEAMTFLRKVKELCDQTENCYIQSFDIKPCNCYELEMSGDCSCEDSL